MTMISLQEQARTRMFARVLGPFYVIISGIGVVRAARLQTLPGLSDFGVWPWATGALELMVGIIIIAFHQYWRSAAAVVVSLLGWGSALQGFLILAYPTIFDNLISGTNLWRAFYVCLGLTGVYLTYVGWKPAAGLMRRHRQG